MTVNQLMFSRRVTRKMLGEALGVTGSSVGRKLRGEIGWTVEDLVRASGYLEVQVSSLLPEPLTDGSFRPAVVEAARRPMEGSNLRPAD